MLLEPLYDVPGVPPFADAPPPNTVGELLARGVLGARLLRAARLAASTHIAAALATAPPEPQP